MINYRFPFLFAVCLAGLSITSSGSCVEIKLEKSDSTATLVAEQGTIKNTNSLESNRSITTAEILSYDRYMEAGYAANQLRDYSAALQNFRQALTIRPQDTYAQIAIGNVSAYAFDRLMQAGYAADRKKEYLTALEYFRQAKEIRPDSFYARQAVNNVSQYLAQNNQDNSESNNQGFFWLGLSLLTAIAAVGIFVFLWLQKGDRQLSQTENVATAPKITSVHEEDPELKSQWEQPDDGDFNKEQNDISMPPQLNISAPLVPQSSSISKLDIVPELIKDLDSGDRQQRRKAIWELAQKSDSRAMKPLVELMIDADSQERGLILEAMTQIATRTLKPLNQALSLSLEDENSQVRQNAIRDLTRVYELMSQVTQRLSQAVEDSDEEVKDTAKWALKQLNNVSRASLNQNDVDPNEPNSAGDA